VVQFFIKNVKAFVFCIFMYTLKASFFQHPSPFSYSLAIRATKKPQFFSLCLMPSTTYYHFKVALKKKYMVVQIIKKCNFNTKYFLLTANYCHCMFKKTEIIIISTKSFIKKRFFFLYFFYMHS
jgi:hypothetical protein